MKEIDDHVLVPQKAGRKIPPGKYEGSLVGSVAILCCQSLFDKLWHFDLLAITAPCTDERFAEFAQQVGVEWGPLHEDRVALQIEIDALVAHAYGLDEADLYTILEDFTERAVPLSYRDRFVARFREGRH